MIEHIIELSIRNRFLVLAVIALEWKGIGFAKWSYNERMPIVPAVEVGLWPLLQLSILVPASMIVAALESRMARSRQAGSQDAGAV